MKLARSVLPPAQIWTNFTGGYTLVILEMSPRSNPLSIVFKNMRDQWTLRRYQNDELGTTQVIVVVARFLYLFSEKKGILKKRIDSHYTIYKSSWIYGETATECIEDNCLSLNLIFLFLSESDGDSFVIAALQN